jgi:TetR/AcrR family transcriptional regulator, transcriptional repressor for nem operon
MTAIIHIEDDVCHPQCQDLPLKERKMARSQAEKDASHRRIVKAAAAQIRRDGVDAVRVSELMREAGLTHGGFYRHFASREDLIDEAIDTALTDGSRQADTGESLDPDAELAQIIDGYVSKAHRDNPQVGCAVAALPADVSRSGSRARHAYSRQVRRYIDRLVGLIRQADPDTKRDEAVLTLSAVVGAVAMARAVDDAALSDEILARTADALHRRAAEAAR